jgi:hypothetical protein
MRRFKVQCSRLYLGINKKEAPEREDGLLGCWVCWVIGLLGLLGCWVVGFVGLWGLGGSTKREGI